MIYRTFNDKIKMYPKGRAFALRSVFCRASNALQRIETAVALDGAKSVLVSDHVHDVMRIKQSGVRGVHIRQDAPVGLLERINQIGFDNIVDDMLSGISMETVSFNSWLVHNVPAEWQDIISAVRKRHEELQVIMSALNGWDYSIADQIYRTDVDDECIDGAHIDNDCDVVLCSSFYGTGAQYYWGDDISESVYERVHLGEDVDLSAYRSSIAKMWDIFVFKGCYPFRPDAKDAQIHNSGPGKRFTQVYEY